MSSLSIERNIREGLYSYVNVANESKQIEKKASAAHPLKKNFIATVELWLQRSQQRKQLAQLDKYQLDDIGLTVEMAAKEASKPFWK